MSVYRNNVAVTVSSAPGTGNITQGAALAGQQSMTTAYGAGTWPVDIDARGTGVWTVERNCSLNGATGVITRGTVEDGSSGPGVRVSLPADTVVRVALPANVLQQIVLDDVAGPNAATTMETGKRYAVDLSTFTADRTYTLPATCAVGDRIQVIVTVGSATRAVLFTAATGDTLNGVAGGTEWSRLFITGETLTFVCTAANAAWVVESSRMIQSKAWLFRDATISVASGSDVKVLLNTANVNIGGIADLANSRVLVRRTGTYRLYTDASSGDPSTISTHRTRIFVNEALLTDTAISDIPPNGGTVSNIRELQLNVGDRVELYYRHASGSSRTYWGSPVAINSVALQVYEVLNDR